MPYTNDDTAVLGMYICIHMDHVSASNEPHTAQLRALFFFLSVFVQFFFFFFMIFVVLLFRVPVSKPYVSVYLCMSEANEYFCIKR